MRINKHSWHWKWLRFVYADNSDSLPFLLAPWWMREEIKEKPFNGPKDLCSYFWALAFSPLVLAILAAMLSWLWVATIVVLAIWHVLRFAWKAVVLTFLVFWTALTAVVHGVRAVAGRKPREKPTTTKPPEPSILVTYIAARKRKVCPLIEYVDGAA